ncbi:MAG: hypothetical protein WBF90_21325 [Rivularia sp. (in: cyanobacteria)]|jgi:hypothetical protein
MVRFGGLLNRQALAQLAQRSLRQPCAEFPAVRGDCRRVEKQVFHRTL